MRGRMRRWRCWVVAGVAKGNRKSGESVASSEKEIKKKMEEAWRG